jgi:hypothetical protein
MNGLTQKIRFWISVSTLAGVRQVFAEMLEGRNLKANPKYWTLN